MVTGDDGWVVVSVSIFFLLSVAVLPLLVCPGASA